MSWYEESTARLTRMLTRPDLSLSEQAYFNALLTQVQQTSQALSAAAPQWSAATISNAFALGAQQQAAEISFTAVHNQAIRALSDYSAGLIREISADMERAVRTQIALGLAQGVGRDELISRIAATGLQAGRWSSPAQRAGVIARTEIMRAYNHGAIASAAESGTDRVEWIATEDERTCYICGPLDGKVFAMQEISIPAHPRCRCTVAAYYGPEPAASTAPATAAAITSEGLLPADPTAVEKWMRYDASDLSRVLTGGKVITAQDRADLTAAFLHKQELGALSERARPSSVAWAKQVWGSKTGPFFRSLSKDELAAAQDYSGAGFRAINTFLRKGTNGSAALRRRIDSLASAVSRTSLDQDLIFHRGTTLSAFDRYHPKTFIGKVITEPGFMSTSVKAPSGFLDINYGVRLRILAPKGTKAMYMEPVTSVVGEQEVLFAPGTRMRVMKVVERKRAGRVEYVVDVTIEP